LKKFIATTIREYLNENKINDIEFSLKNVDDEYVVLSKINNKIIGELRFIKSKYKPVLKAGSVVVQPNYRRKGIATAMYDFAEKQLNLKFEKNTDVLTPDGKLFWSSRN
jgi:predicted N-acetyltransferase YhbS